MKQVLLVLSVIMVSFLHISCERVSSADSSGDKVRVQFNVVNADTKSVSDTERDVIRSMDVLVFMAETGELISYDSVKEGSISLYFQRGVLHDCCFIINAPKGTFDDVKEYSQMHSKFSHLADNMEAFVMQGSFSRMFVSDGNLDVEVSRLCSKVVVDKLVAKFMETELKNTDVVLKRIFLMNTSSTIGYFNNSIEEGSLLNVDGFDNSLDQVIKDQISEEYDMVIENDSVLDLNTSLYCYSADENNDGVSVSKLVLELEIAGSVNYYTALLPKLEPNNEYHIDTIRLLGFGSDSPGEVYDRSEIVFVVTVNPWEVAIDKDAVMN